MARVIEKTIYQFDELSDRAKERARDWFREGNGQDEWWDSTYEDVAHIADILGIDIRQKPVKLMNSSTRYNPAIYFSGFSSQGDGACFEGRYSYPGRCTLDPHSLKTKRDKNGKPPNKLLGEYLGGDDKQTKAIYEIADSLQDLQRRHFYGLSAQVAHYDRYCHSFSTEISVYKTVGDLDLDISEDVIEALRDCLRNFMDWIYRQLEVEWDYMNSDEVVDENILANEYEFDEDGNRI